MLARPIPVPDGRSRSTWTLRGLFLTLRKVQPSPVGGGDIAVSLQGPYRLWAWCRVTHRTTVVGPNHYKMILMVYMVGGHCRRISLTPLRGVPD
jgi:hypothetical protein